MQDLLVESSVRVILIAAVIAMVLYVMRIKTASSRHAVWAGVVLVMMLLPAFLRWAPRAPLPVLPRAAGQTAVSVLPVVDGPASAPVAVRTRSAAPQAFVWSWPTFFAGLYLLGLSVLLLRLAIGTARVRWLLRGAVVRDGRLTHASCSTPITVGWVQPSVILPVDWSAWPAARLDAILVHEREHARRRDPLFQSIALLNRALFWFHPLAWWLERRLSGLAEEACDTAVLARGHDPRDYSEYLLDLARSVERAGTRVDTLGMAMPGAFLHERIRRMLSGTRAPRISRRRMACTVAVCVVMAGILAMGTLVRAQSGGSKGPVFEVASIRPSTPSVGLGGAGRSGPGGPKPQVSHGRFSYTGSLFGLIVKAYGLKGCGVVANFGEGDCVRLSEGPDWVKSNWVKMDRFEIEAKTPDGAPDYTLTQFTNGQAPQLQLMLQALLRDRFKLNLHREEKQLPVYALTVGKNGPKLKQAEEGEQFSMNFGTLPPPNADTVRLTVKNRPMQELTDTLSEMMDRVVLDRTGLSGKFDFTMEYQKDADAGGLSAFVGPSMFTAFQEQLGLKLESTKGPVEVLVIDHAEKPSEN